MLQFALCNGEQALLIFGPLLMRNQCKSSAQCIWHSIDYLSTSLQCRDALLWAAEACSAISCLKKALYLGELCLDCSLLSFTQEYKFDMNVRLDRYLTCTSMSLQGISNC